MYTQCPDCSAAFRVTANDLKQAAGKVRCGGCGSAFDALEFLSEEMPEQPSGKESASRPPELKPDGSDSGLPESVSPEESIALLKTLDELTGSDIRIEDTGIEWRVLDDQVIAELETADDAEAPADADSDQQADQTRYDDDTPVPEDNGETDAPPSFDADAPEEESPDDETESHADDMQADDEPVVDVDFGDDETGDWEEILEEVDDADKPDRADEPDVADETDEGVDEQLPRLADALTDEELSKESYDDNVTDPDGEQSGETDEEDKPLPVVQPVDAAFEAIVMEGETVRNTLDDLAEGAQVNGGDITYWTPPEENVAPPRSASTRFSLAAVALLLLLLLSLQVMHHYRETLATIPAVQRIIAPVYRTMGAPLSPDWDVTGWRFEATQGNADDDTNQLTIYSRIGNTTDKPMPYPLIGISLTDRFDDTVGSRLLEPAEFLTGDANPRRLVPAGTTFDAVISIRSVDESATGYKLNVCYRDTGGASAGRLRCAIGDFKE